MKDYLKFVSLCISVQFKNKSPTWCNNFSIYYPDVCLQLNMFQPRTQHDYHHDTKLKPEAATAVIELLMMGGKTPETCW
jgi:hypothetical protein